MPLLSHEQCAPARNARPLQQPARNARALQQPACFARTLRAFTRNARPLQQPARFSRPLHALARNARSLPHSAHLAGLVQVIPQSGPVYAVPCSFRREMSGRKPIPRSSCTLGAWLCSTCTVASEFACINPAKRVSTTPFPVRTALTAHSEHAGKAGKQGTHVRASVQSAGAPETRRTPSGTTDARRRSRQPAPTRAPHRAFTCTATMEILRHRPSSVIR